MQQTFQCFRCGAVNWVGEGNCANCGQLFQYTCPRCGVSVNNTIAYCTYCQFALLWPGRQYVSYQDEPGACDEKSSPRRANPRLIAMLCVVLAAMIMGVLAYLNRPVSSPSSPSSPQTLPALEPVRPATFENTFDNTY